MSDKKKSNQEQSKKPVERIGGKAHRIGESQSDMSRIQKGSEVPPRPPKKDSDSGSKKDK